MPSPTDKYRRLFAFWTSECERKNFGERESAGEKERERKTVARCLVFLLIIQFVLSFCSLFFSLSLSCSLALFPSTFHKATENGTRLSFLSLLIRLVIYDGGRQPIEIARRNAYTHGRSPSRSPSRSLVLALVGLDKTHTHTHTHIHSSNPMHDHHDYCQASYNFTKKW